MNKTTEAVIQTTNEMIQNLFIETSWSRNMRSLLCNSMVTGEDSPEAWGWIFSMIPKEISGTDEQVSIEEKAIYLALCLYAATAGDRTADCTMVEAMKYLDMDRTICGARFICLDSVSFQKEGHSTMPSSPEIFIFSRWIR